MNVFLWYRHKPSPVDDLAILAVWHSHAPKALSVPGKPFNSAVFLFFLTSSTNITGLSLID